MNRLDKGKNVNDRAHFISEIVKFIEIEEGTSTDPPKIVYEMKIIEDHIKK